MYISPTIHFSGTCFAIARAATKEKLSKRVGRKERVIEKSLSKMDAFLQYSSRGSWKDSGRSALGGRSLSIIDLQAQQWTKKEEKKRGTPLFLSRKKVPPEREREKWMGEAPWLLRRVERKLSTSMKLLSTFQFLSPRGFSSCISAPPWYSWGCQAVLQNNK